jgi:hypothetical protein
MHKHVVFCRVLSPHHFRSFQFTVKRILLLLAHRAENNNAMGSIPKIYLVFFNIFSALAQLIFGLLTGIFAVFKAFVTLEFLDSIPRRGAHFFAFCNSMYW